MCAYATFFSLLSHPLPHLFFILESTAHGSSRRIQTRGLSLEKESSTRAQYTRGASTCRSIATDDLVKLPMNLRARKLTNLTLNCFI